MRFNFLVALISLFLIEQGFCVHREDVQSAPEEAHKFAVSFPVQMGILIGESSEQGSAVFLNETTALTSAHTAMLHGTERQIIVACDELKTIFPSPFGKFSFVETFRHLTPGTWSTYKTHFLGEFQPTELETTNLMNLLSSNFDNEIELFTDPEKNNSFSELFSINGENYTLKGSDLAVLKLPKPLTLRKDPAKLMDINPQDLTQLPAYAFGYEWARTFSNGKQERYEQKTKDALERTSKISAISLPPVKFLQNRHLFYASYPAYGGNDESFIIENLPSKPKGRDKFYGRIFQGMSGGPLFFQEKENYILGGIISQTQVPPFVFPIISLQDDSDPVIKKKANAVLAKLKKRVIPTYDAYQSFSEEDLIKIKELMKQ